MPFFAIFSDTQKEKRKEDKAQKGGGVKYKKKEWHGKQISLLVRPDLVVQEELFRTISDHKLISKQRRHQVIME